MTTVHFLSAFDAGWLIQSSDDDGATLLDLAQRYGVPLPAHCREGTCGGCAIKVLPTGPSRPRYVRLGTQERKILFRVGKLNPEEVEHPVLSWRSPRWRLACQCRLNEANHLLVAF